MIARLDHLVVTAPTLAEGVAYVADCLGVAPRPGGRHPRMGTHNSLLRLGPATYLEVIAVDPEGRAEGPRWFLLDEAQDEPPRLATWVARVADIRSAAPVFGRVRPMERGALSWEITLPDQGGLPLDGIAPTLIQWHAEPHPAAQMPDSGCSLVALEGFHPRPVAVSALLRTIGFQGPFSVAAGPAGLVARIRTPRGEAMLS